jgi:O-antigen/teichoic acid export membrane protein
MNSTDRIAFNTSILYGRMIITMGITLFSTRLLLNVLGEVDYGIFNLIAGIILMLSFLNNAMATSTQRYLSYYQGKNDIILQKKIFINSLVIHIYIAILLIIVLELAGVFFFNGVLKITVNRMDSSKVVYHFISGSVFFSVLSVPFNASLIAHENMLWVAIINIMESVLKFGATLLLYYSEYDKLILYGKLTFVISGVSFLFYACYCLIKYEECNVRPPFNIDKSITKDLTSFAGWNLFGALSGIGKTQGVAILLNVFFGAKVNAAYGISNQVSGQLNFFSGTMLRAINPQIMKSEGENDRPRMIKLSLIASKFGFLLLAIFAIPCIFEMDAILKYWLKNVPEYAANFCSLILIAFMVNQITVGLDSAAQATGKIKKYMLLVGSTKLMIIPVAFILLKLDFSIYSVFCSYIILEGLGGICRIYILNKLVNLSLNEFVSKVVIPVSFPLIFAICIDYGILQFTDSIYRPLFLLPISFFVMAICIYIFGLEVYEKKIVKNMVKKVVFKFSSKK